MSTAEIDLTCSPTIFGIPSSHYDCTLKNFKWDREKDRVKEGFFEYLRELEAFIGGDTPPSEHPPNLILVGQPGNGKTHLTVGLYRWAVARTDTMRSVWLDVSEFCDEVKRSYDGGGEDPWEKVRYIDTLLVLDDLFGRERTPHEIQHVINPLIGKAYNSRVSLVTTTNYERPQIANFLHDHEMSRLESNGRMLKLKGPDRRL